jgi:hypothetical protein
MRKGHLPRKARKIVRALIEVVKPRKPDFDLPVEDEMLEFLDNYYSHFPWHMKFLFPVGVYLLEYGTFIFKAWLRPFTILPLSKKEIYITDWIESRMALRRDLIKGVKGLCLTAFYSLPQVMEHIGYDLPGHIERVNKGEPCDPEACEFFRDLGYDRNSRIPYPAYDRVDLITHDTLPPEESAETKEVKE